MSLEEDLGLRAVKGETIETISFNNSRFKPQTD